MSMRKHVETIVVALLASGLMGLVNFYVQAQSSTAVMRKQLANHEERLGELERAAQAIAVTQERLATTQQMIVQLQQRFEQRHDMEMREIRGGR